MKFKIIKFYSLFLISVLVSIFCFSAEIKTEVKSKLNKLVFAHYMPSFPVYGDSIEGYKKEILQAKQTGIDGFAIFVSSYKLNQSKDNQASTINNRIFRLFEALLELKSEFASNNKNFVFYLFLAPAGNNFKNSLQVSETSDIHLNRLVEVIEDFALNDRYKDVYFKIDNKSVLNPWAGASQGIEFWSSLLNRFESPLKFDKNFKSFRNLNSEENNIVTIKYNKLFFLPWFLQLDKSMNDPELGIQNLFSQYNSIIDGSYWWGVGRELTQTHQSKWYDNYFVLQNLLGCYAKNCLKNNFNITKQKVFVDGVSPAYWSTCKDNDSNLIFPGSQSYDLPYSKYLEYQGGRGYSDQWERVIKNNIANFVIIGTWNDIGEGHYIAFNREKLNKKLSSQERAQVKSLDPLRYLKEGKILTSNIVNYSHEGFSELTNYYSNFYKKGVSPELPQKVLVFYRTHLKGSLEEFDSTSDSDDTCTQYRKDLNSGKTIKSKANILFKDAEDKIFITVMISEKLFLKVKSGKIEQNIELTPGRINHLALSLSEGEQIFELYKDKEFKNIISSTKGADIEQAPKARNYNIYSLVLNAK